MKTRLNEYMRTALKEHAKSLIRCAEEQAAHDSAYADLTAAGDRIYASKFNERDMEVLKRWEVAEVADFVGVQLRGQHQCTYIKMTKARLLPMRGYRDSYHYAVVLPVEDPVWGIHSTFKAAESALRDAWAAKMADYRVLITESRNLEDVIEVWPEAASVPFAVRSRDTALARLNLDVVARIKADVATRAAPIETPAS